MTNLDLKFSSKSEWIEMFPFGVAIGADRTRPVMIFKDKSEKRVLPVWLSPMDAGIAVAQRTQHHSTPAALEGSPHEIAWRVLESLQIELEKCLFKTLKGQHQYLELHFRSRKGRKLPAEAAVIESPADDSISFCMRSGCKFFATVDYIEKSRVLEGEIALGARQPIEVNPHPYLN